MPARRCAGQSPSAATSGGPRRGAVDAALAGAARRGAWTGRGGRLSANRVQWDVIDAVAEASRERDTPAAVPAAARRNRPARPAPWKLRLRLLLQRRSAQSMDDSTAIDAGRFA